MTRKIGKAKCLTVAGLIAAATVAGCSGGSIGSDSTGTPGQRNVGDVSFNLLLSDGQTIGVVNYAVTGPFSPPPGTINVSDPNATASVTLGLPVGTGYNITMTAVTNLGADCSASAPFNVVAPGPNLVTLTLVCEPLNTGNPIEEVDVIATINPGDPAACPDVQYYTAAPQTTSNGGSIALAALATSGGIILPAFYQWSASGGSITGGATPSATFTCPALAPTQDYTITLAITDGPTGVCVDTETFDVHCIAATICGNGGAPEPGEECDDGNAVAGDGCTNCTIDPFCGDGTIDVTLGEQCDDGNTTADDGCGPTCQTELVVCGDGDIDAPEVCEPSLPLPPGTPPGSTCNGTTCQIDGPLCGNGVLNAGEECEPPNTAYCSSTCQIGGACTTCEELNCGGTAIHEACTGDPLCVAALNCSRQPYNGQANCYANGQADCFCGAGTDVLACEAGTTPAVGPCVASYNAAAGASPTQGQVLARLGDPSFPIGDAGFMQLCDQSFCPVCF